MIFASIALMGLPFFSGFYSKEKILESSFFIFNATNLFAFWLGSLSAFFTAIYSIKLIYLSFYNNPKNFKQNYLKYFHFQNNLNINFILLFLGLGSIFCGYFLSDLIIGNASDFFIFNYNNISYYQLDFHLGKLNLALLPVYYTLLGIFSSFLIFNNYFTSFIIFILTPIKMNFFIKIYKFLSNRWYLNYFYNRIIATKILQISYNFTYFIIDQGYLNYNLGQFFIINLINNYFKLTKQLKFLSIYNLIFSIIFSYFIFFFIFFPEIIIEILIVTFKYFFFFIF